MFAPYVNDKTIRRTSKMLVLKERKNLAPGPNEMDAFTRKQLLNAHSGEISLVQLENMKLSRREIARFLMRQIPMLRAAAIGGGFNALGLFLDESYRVLASEAKV
jgi:hypothetical protein